MNKINIASECWANPTVPLTLPLISAVQQSQTKKDVSYLPSFVAFEKTSFLRQFIQFRGRECVLQFKNIQSCMHLLRRGASTFFCLVLFLAIRLSSLLLVLSFFFLVSIFAIQAASNEKWNSMKLNIKIIEFHTATVGLHSSTITHAALLCIQFENFRA